MKKFGMLENVIKRIADPFQLKTFCKRMDNLKGKNIHEYNGKCGIRNKDISYG